MRTQFSESCLPSGDHSKPTGIDHRWEIDGSHVHPTGEVFFILGAKTHEAYLVNQDSVLQLKPNSVPFFTTGLFTHEQIEGSPDELIVGYTTCILGRYVSYFSVIRKNPRTYVDQDTQKRYVDANSKEILAIFGNNGATYLLSGGMIPSGSIQSKSNETHFFFSPSGECKVCNSDTALCYVVSSSTSIEPPPGYFFFQPDFMIAYDVRSDIRAWANASNMLVVNLETAQFAVINFPLNRKSTETRTYLESLPVPDRFYSSTQYFRYLCETHSVLLGATRPLVVYRNFHQLSVTKDVLPPPMYFPTFGVYDLMGAMMYISIQAIYASTSIWEFDLMYYLTGGTYLYTNVMLNPSASTTDILAATPATWFHQQGIASPYYMIMNTSKGTIVGVVQPTDCDKFVSFFTGAKLIGGFWRSVAWIRDRFQRLSADRKPGTEPSKFFTRVNYAYPEEYYVVDGVVGSKLFIGNPDPNTIEDDHIPLVRSSVSDVYVELFRLSNMMEGDEVNCDDISDWRFYIQRALPDHVATVLQLNLGTHTLTRQPLECKHKKSVHDSGVFVSVKPTDTLELIDQNVIPTVCCASYNIFEVIEEHLLQDLTDRWKRGEQGVSNYSYEFLLPFIVSVADPSPVTSMEDIRTSPAPIYIQATIQVVFYGYNMPRYLIYNRLQRSNLDTQQTIHFFTCSVDVNLDVSVSSAGRLINIVNTTGSIFTHEGLTVTAKVDYSSGKINEESVQVKLNNFSISPGNLFHIHSYSFTGKLCFPKCIAAPVSPGEDWTMYTHTDKELIQIGYKENQFIFETKELDIDFRIRQVSDMKAFVNWAQKHLKAT